MTTTFRAGITRILTSCVDEVVRFVLAQSMGEVMGMAAETAPVRTKAEKTESGRRPRRTAEDIAKGAAKVLALLQKSPEGLRAEQIREGIGCEAAELPRYIAELGKQLRTKGQKRGTTYFVKAAPAKKAAPKKAPAKKATKKVTKETPALPTPATKAA
jgi:ribonuclease E